MRARTALMQHESGRGWSAMATAAPGAALRGHVRRYAGYEEHSDVPLRRRELPSATAALIVSFGPRIRVHGQGEPRSFVAGLHDRPAVTEFHGDQHGVQIDLTPLAARRLLGVPMDRVGFPVVELEDVLGRDGRELTDRLAEVPDWDARFALLDDVLARRLAEAPEPPPALAWAWGQLVGSAGRVPVGALAAETGWSDRRLRRGFRDHVGLAPKTFARVLRFRRAVERLEREGAQALGDVALDCGYYDQAHFNRDFRAFAGGPPTDYFARLLPGGMGVAG
jgi:AraC-like DNA-binding protein